MAGSDSERAAFKTPVVGRKVQLLVMKGHQSFPTEGAGIRGLEGVETSGQRSPLCWWERGSLAGFSPPLTRVNETVNN